MTSFPKINPNRIQFNYERDNLSIDYALTICGSHLSNQYDENFNIVGNRIDDVLRGIGVWDANGKNIYSAFLSVASLHLDHYLITDIALKRIYEMAKGLSAIDFMIYDLPSKSIYTFDTSCSENNGYNYDNRNFIFDTSYGEMREITDAEVLVLSMGSDSVFDENGNTRT